MLPSLHALRLTSGGQFETTLQLTELGVWLWGALAPAAMGHALQSRMLGESDCFITLPHMQQTK